MKSENSSVRTAGVEGEASRGGKPTKQADDAMLFANRLCFSFGIKVLTY